MDATFVIVGGGIAGVSCAETLSFLEPNKSIILVTESPVVKAIINIRMLTKTLSTFDVIEKDMQYLSDTHPNITVIQDSLIQINSKDHSILTKANKSIKYRYLCLCMGGSPKIIPQGENSPYVFGIRDTDSVETLIEKIGKSKRIALVGNGGIATELIYKIENVEVEWIVKDKHITATFVDPGAAEFFKSSLTTSADTPAQSHTYRTHMKYKEDNKPGSGAALGPDWYNNFKISGANSTTPKTVNIHYQCEIAEISYKSEVAEYPVEIRLTNGEVVCCDIIVSATGVLPRTNIITDAELKISSTDHGILVNNLMNTSLVRVYAAGDVCTPDWTYAKHWFPMRLWSQAREMGCYAAKCMAGKLNHEEVLDFSFELFAHSTKLFGYKVVLLGLYNGQTLGTDYECLIRTTPKMEFIKFVIKDGRLQGAILIGDTDLAETCENLILNQLDLTPYGDDILNPDIDIEDYFD